MGGRPSVGHMFTGEQIETRSFQIIDELLAGADQTRPEWPVIRRIVHATGDPTIAEDVRVHPQAVAAGIESLRAGRPIIADVRMVAGGISRRLATRFGCTVVCAIGDPVVAELARADGVTRSVAAMRHLSATLPGAVVAIGNAPTALFALLDYLAAGNPPPALIVGTPVGFVGAAESKAALVQSSGSLVPYITVVGPRGGSALAVAAVNALLHLAAQE
ncbi:MAG: precorrin-8X methylmutase [Chloroflexota bacterium]